jgi:hypothetical protein
VAIIPPGVRVGTAAAEERSSNAASDAVINANTLFIDEITAGLGRHGRPRVSRCATQALCSYQQKRRGASHGLPISGKVSERLTYLMKIALPECPNLP